MADMTYRTLNNHLNEMLKVWPELRMLPEMQAVETIFREREAGDWLDEHISDGAQAAISIFNSTLEAIISHRLPGPIPPIPSAICGELPINFREGWKPVGFPDFHS